MPLGRPTTYKAEYAAQAEKLCRLGATDMELADFFGCNQSTIYQWSQKNEAFSKSLRAGKEEADARVERSLYHRAVGYSHEAVKIFMPAGREEPVYAPYREHVPPEFGSMKLWLVNRQGDKWSDKQEHKHDHNISDELTRLFAGAVKHVNK